MLDEETNTLIALWYLGKDLVRVDFEATVPSTLPGYPG
jgi:hypothetical protein